MKRITLFLVGLFVTVRMFGQTLDADYKRLYARLEKEENLNVNDFQKLIDTYKKQLDNFPDESAELFYYKGNYLYADNLLDKAIESFNTAYNYSLKAKDTTFRYYVILAFARMSMNMENYSKAEEYYQYALPGMAIIYGPSSLGYTKIYFEYIRLLIKLDRLKEAKPLLDALEYYFVTLNMHKDPTYLAVLGNLGYVLQETGNYKEALQKYKLVMEDNNLLKNGDTLEHVIMLSNIGETYREMGLYDEALSNMQTAKRFMQKYKIKNDDQAASIENNLGLLYKTLADYKTSEECFDNSIRIYKHAGLDNTEPYCSVLSNKADLMRLLGRKDDGLRLLETSITIRQKYFGKNSENYANAISNYALILYEYDKVKDAKEFFEEALLIYEKTISKTHQSYANCLNNLSGCYFINGDYKKAEEYKFEAIRIIESTLGKEHYKYISFCTGASDILIHNKNYNKAFQLLSETKALSKKKFGTNHELYIRALISLGSVKYLMGNYKESLGDFEEAIGNKLNIVNQFFYAMNKEDQIYFLDEIQKEMFEYSTCLFNYAQKDRKADIRENYEKYFNYHLILKSLLNKSTTEWQRKVGESNDATVKENYKKWVQLNGVLNELYRSDFTMQEQDSIQNLIKGVEMNLKKAMGNIQIAKVDFKIIKGLLKADEAIVDISWYLHILSDTNAVTRYIALISKKNSEKPECIFLSDPGKDDKDRVRNYNENMEAEIKDTLSYDAFFGKMQSTLKGISKLYLSPAGDYSRINFQTLYNPKTKKYVIEEIDMVYLPDLSSILNQESVNTNKDAELFGNPDFNFDFKKKVNPTEVVKEKQNLLAKRFGLTTITDLPGTETELKEIEKFLLESNWKLKSFTRENANEDNLRKLNSPKLLHIATHGYFISEVDSREDRFLGYNTAAFKQLADVRSGLILAGAALNTSDSSQVTSEKDGLLTSREASLLNLSKTDLVVLSACQTGLGVETLNMGVIGLQQAFSNAGAKNLILSLWPVDDNATQLLMVKFYEYWLKNPTNENISSAFKKAQLGVKQQYPHPYYWGAFVLLKN